MIVNLNLLVNQIIVIRLLLRDSPCPVVTVLRLDGYSERGVEATTVLDTLTNDGVAPTLVVEPVVTLAPEVEATIELYLGQQVVTSLGALRVSLIKLRSHVEEQLLCLSILAKVAVSLSLCVIHLSSTDKGE